MSNAEPQQSPPLVQQITVVISTKEMIRFSVFIISTMVAILMQMQIFKQSQMNRSLQSSMFQLVDNIFIGDSKSTRFELLKWADNSLYRLYNLNNFEDDFNPKLLPITNLTLQASYVKIDETIQVWDFSGTEDQQPQGVFQQYTAPFVIQFQPWQVFKRRAASADKARDINENSLRLFNLGYFSEAIKSLTASAAYYSPDMQMIALFRMKFTFLPAGKAYKELKIDSFRTNYYMNSDDVVRLVFEIFFLLCYASYLFDEGYKIYWKINQALAEDKRQQEALKKKQDQKRELQKKNKAEQNAQNPDEENSNQTQNIVDQLMKDQQRKLQIIVNTVLNHIKDIWSALDVFILVMLGIAVSKYIYSVTDAPYEAALNESFEAINNTIELFSKKPYLNEMMVQADQLNLYRRLISVAILIMWIKALKYVIYSFNRLIQYLDIILNVVEYMVFYLILLISVLMSFSLFLYFMYGSAVFEAANIGRALVYILGFMFGSNDKFQEFYKYDEVITFMVVLLFYFIVTIILLNMFFVFVKAEYNNYQDNLESTAKKQDKKHDEAVTYLHPFWQIYNLVEYFVARFWFTFTLRKNKFDEFMELKEDQHKIYVREFKENPQQIDFNIDFSSLMNSTAEESAEQKFLTQEEKESIINKQKMELIKLIWKTILLLLILSLNFVLVQEFYSPQEAFLQTDSLQRKISYGASQQSFINIKTKVQLLDWLENHFSQLFDENLFGQREIQLLTGGAQPVYNIDKSANEQQQIEQYQLKEYSFANLKRGYSLNTFNIVVNNIVRITIRRSNIIDNPDPRFQKLSPKVSLLFLEDPLQDLSSENENITDFSSESTSLGNVTVEFSTDTGYQNQRGLVMLIEPRQLGGLIQTLNSVDFFETVSSIVLEIVTFNPGNKRGFAHTKIWFTINQCEVIENKQIDVSPIKKNSLQSFAEISILLLSVSLIIALTYYIYVTIKTMLHKNFSYNRWYNTYVLLAMNNSQLHFRERHMPEFIRQSLYLMDISQLLNLLFLVLMGSQISMILIYFFQVNALVQASYIYEQPLNNILKSTIFENGISMDNFTFFSQVQGITDSSRLIGIFGSLAIIVLCLEILYLVSHNRDFQMLTNSIKYTLSHLPFIMIVLYGFILAFTTMGHLLLGTEMVEFSTFYSSLVQFTDYILKIPNMGVFRNDDRTLEFFLMIFPYILTVRFIIINIFFSIALRGYLLSRKSADEAEKDIKTQSVSLTPYEFLILSIQMFTFKERLNKVGSDQYLIQLIRQFDPYRVINQMKENIRNPTNLTAMKAWAEECAKEIKDEKELRKPMDVACNEILQAYIDLNNKGVFNILEQLEQDQKRKMIEFSLKYTYIHYFRTTIDQLDKFNIYFQNKRELMKKVLFSEEKSEDYNRMVYIASLEAQLEENIQSMTFIRQELIALGQDVDINEKELSGEDKQKEARLIKQKRIFQNPLSANLKQALMEAHEEQINEADEIQHAEQPAEAARGPKRDIQPTDQFQPVAPQQQQQLNEPEEGQQETTVFNEKKKGWGIFRK